MSANDEKVGYGRPPQSGRFKPGQSGNPKGRPKKSKDSKPQDMSHVLKATLERQVKIRENGKTRQVSIAEALIQKTVAQAFEGNARAMNNLMKLCREAGLMEKLPVAQKYIGGVLVVGSPQSEEEWERETEEQQRKYREPPYLKGPSK